MKFGTERPFMDMGYDDEHRIPVSDKVPALVPN